MSVESFITALYQRRDGASNVTADTRPHAKAALNTARHPKAWPWDPRVSVGIAEFSPVKLVDAMAAVREGGHSSAGPWHDDRACMAGVIRICAGLGLTCKARFG